MPSKATASSQTKVNTAEFTATSAMITALEDGGWIVTWRSALQDGSGLGVYQQRYADNGKPVDDEERVNFNTSGDQSVQSVIGLDDGGWVVVWQWTNGSSDIYIQRYDAEGEKVGNEDYVNSGWTTGDQSNASITSLVGGGWVVTWQGVGDGNGDSNIYQQLYDADGHKVGSYQRVNATASGNQQDAIVTALAGGGWVVGWDTRGGGTEPEYRYFDFFDASGTRVKGDTPIYAADAPGVIAMAGVADGGFVIAFDSTGFDDSGRGVHHVFYEADGDVVSFGTVNTTTAGNQTDAAVTALADGGWVIVWTSDDGAGTGIYQQRYDAEGDAVGTETRVNEDTTGDQSRASVVGLKDGSWIVSWDGDGADGDDAVYQRHFAVDIDGTGGNNTLKGTDWGEAINGLGGKDKLDAGKGNDILVGGKASDRFIFRTGCDEDLIRDFDAKGADHDIIDLKGLKSVKNFADLKANHLEKSRGDLVIDAGKGDETTLDGVKMKDLDAGDFLF